MIKQASYCILPLAAFLGLISLPFKSYDLVILYGRFPDLLAEGSDDFQSRLEANKLTNEGSLRYLQGQYEEALEAYKKALLIYRQIGHRAQEGNLLQEIGGIYIKVGQYDKALEIYQEALVLYWQIGDLRGEASLYNQLGLIYQWQGDYNKALEVYQQSLQIYRSTGDQEREGQTLNNLGTLYYHQSQYERAIEVYERALTLFEEIKNEPGQGSIFNNIGLVYLQLGEAIKALDFYEKSLRIRQKIGDSKGVGVTLHNMGLAYGKRGDDRQALEFYERALRIRTQIGDRSGEGKTLNNLGLLYNRLGRSQEALESLQRALTIFQRLNDKSWESNTLDSLGTFHRSRGNLTAALNYYQESLLLSRDIGDKAQEVTILTHLAIAKNDSGHLLEALKDIEAAVAIVEDIRIAITSEQFRQSYFAQNYQVYQFYIDLLMQLHKQNPDGGYDGKALAASERAKARSLLDILSEADADIRSGLEPQLREKERSLQERINATASRQIELLSTANSAMAITAIQGELDRLLQELDEVRAQIRKTSPRYAALTQPQPFNLEQIQQQVLDEDTLLLQYALGEKRSYLWAVTKTNIYSYELPPRHKIEAAVREFRNSMTAPSMRNSPPVLAAASSALSDMIVAPVADRLDRKRLLIVSDGALHYIPFAALSIPGTGDYQPLLLHHEIVSAPSASTLAVLRKQTANRPLAPHAIAILADPVFAVNDERLQTSEIASRAIGSEAASNILPEYVARSANQIGINGTPDRLPFTRQEAEAILALVPDAEEFKALDFQANRAIATSEELSQYLVVHFATHGFLNSVNPALSGIVLSLVDERGNPIDGFLRLHDIYNLNLAADLVVLSACQTGLGEEIKGEGLVGLSRGFMYAGAPRLVVSLWSVDDLGTSELMSRFYRNYLQAGLTPAAALRTAQIEMLQTPEWKSPYFWAAFNFQGEWQSSN